MNSPTYRRSHRPARLAHGRGGLTLFELLITLVLLAALAAIVAPVMLNRLDERAFESAADTTSEQLLMARAHAQATGEAVEVTYSPTTGQVNARKYAPWSKEFDIGSVEPGTSPLISADAGTAESADSAPAGESLSGISPAMMAGGGGDRDDAGQIIAEGWASRALGRGIRIDTHRPNAAGTDEGEVVWCDPHTGMPIADAGDDYETLDDLVTGQDVRLAVFMPDGSAMIGGNLWLNDDGGRCGRISINPWSGLPIFQRLEDQTADSRRSTTQQSDDRGAPISTESAVHDNEDD